MRETYVNFYSFINKLPEVVALAQAVDCFPLLGFSPRQEYWCTNM